MQQATNNVVPIKLEWASALILRLRTLYGAKFDQNWGGISPDLLAKSWAMELAGFSGEEIKVGLDACKTRDWPPTLPEFMKLCRPHLEPETAFHTAVKGLTARSQGKHGEWSHPAIYWAAVRIGNHDMMNVTFYHLKQRWTAVLAETLAKNQWDPIPEVLVELPAPKANPEKVRESVDAITIDKITPIDPRDWARKIIARVEKKESVPKAVEIMARHALGLV